VGVAGIVLAACGGEALPAKSEPSVVSIPWTSPAVVGTSPSPAAVAVEVSPLPDNLRVSIDQPDANVLLKSPVTVAGVASVHDGRLVAVVLDDAGAELGRGTATASAAYPAFGKYSVTLSFTGGAPGTKGQLKVFGVNPRDGSPTWFYWINVRFP